MEDPRIETTATPTSTERTRREVIEDWLDPTTHPSETETALARDGTHATRHPDGSGTLTVDGELKALQLADGRLIPHPTQQGTPPVTEIAPTETQVLDFPGRFAGAILRAQTQTRIHPARFHRELDGADAYETGILLTHRSGHQAYVGYDATATPGHERFGFALNTESRPKAPSAKDAIALLQPAEATEATHRHGEWWFTPSQSPRGTPQHPSITGASPLANHIPETWATHVPDDVFRHRLRKNYRLPRELADATPQAIVAHYAETDAALPALRAAAGGIHIKGLLHHRRDDHDAVRLRGWHQADTHDWDVLTEDDAGHLMRD